MEKRDASEIQTRFLPVAKWLLKPRITFPTKIQTLCTQEESAYLHSSAGELLDFNPRKLAKIADETRGAFKETKTRVKLAIFQKTIDWTQTKKGLILSYHQIWQLEELVNDAWAG